MGGSLGSMQVPGVWVCVCGGGGGVRVRGWVGGWAGLLLILAAAWFLFLQHTSATLPAALPRLLHPPQDVCFHLEHVAISLVGKGNMKPLVE